MPYTQDELKNVEFYTDFVDELRDNYLTQVSASAQNNFRDQNNILQSYEDILTNSGIEDAELNQVLYKPYITEEQRKNTFTISNDGYPIYTRGQNLNAVINRNFNELTDLLVSDLPGGVEEGDVITNDDPYNQDRFLIENGQKRFFTNIGIFYAVGKTLRDLVTLPQNIIDSINSGEDLI